MDKVTSQKVFGANAVNILSHFLLMPHVLVRLNQNIRGFYGMYRLMRLVESGDIGCFVAQDESGAVIGVGWGRMENENDWVHHFAYARKADAYAGCKAMIKQVKACYGAKRIVGNIPDCHRSAKLLTRRLGFKDCGLTELIHETDDGKEFFCRQFILEI